MLDNNPIFIVVMNAGKAVFFTIAALAVLLVMGLPFGSIYLIAFRGLYIFYVFPTVALMGGVWGLLTMVPLQSSFKNKKRPPIMWNRTTVIGTSTVLALLIAWVVTPYFTLKDTRYVDHAAEWYFVDPNDDDLPWRDWMRGSWGTSCDTQVVLFVMEEFNNTLFVCDPAVTEYLEILEENRVRFTYKLNYNAGDYRSASYYAVSPISVENSRWAGGESCGGKHNHPCDSSSIHLQLVPRQSTWVDGE